MIKKILSNPFFTILIIICIFFTMMYFVAQTSNQYIKNGRVCGGMTPLSNGYDCCKGCEELELTYVKSEVHTGMFSAPVDNCYCRKANEPKQIW